MLHGDRVTLRPAREPDLEALYEAPADIRNRGAFFPLGVMPEPRFRDQFPTTGSGRRRKACSSSSAATVKVAGHIQFFRPVSYWDAWEVSYQLYDERWAGGGYVTEAVQLMTDYLFATKHPNRIQLVIVPENAASRRIAEKCGVTLGGTARGAFFNDGRTQDVVVYSLLRDDPRLWRR